MAESQAAMFLDRVRAGRKAENRENRERGKGENEREESLRKDRSRLHVHDWPSSGIIHWQRPIGNGASSEQQSRRMGLLPAHFCIFLTLMRIDRDQNHYREQIHQSVNAGIGVTPSKEKKNKVVLWCVFVNSCHCGTLLTGESLPQEGGTKEKQLHQF